MIDYRDEGGAIAFTVRVAPRASRSSVGGAHDGALKVRVAAPPVGGAANEELARLLARAFHVPSRAVEIVSGQASKTKRVRVYGANAARLLELARDTGEAR